MAKPERVSKSWTIRKDLVDRVEEEADSRMVGQALIVEKALDAFLDGLTPPVVASTTSTASTHPPALEGK
jgi:hypothetical protein